MAFLIRSALECHNFSVYVKDDLPGIRVKGQLLFSFVHEGAKGKEYLMVVVVGGGQLFTQIRIVPDMAVDGPVGLQIFPAVIIIFRAQQAVNINGRGCP